MVAIWKIAKYICIFLLTDLKNGVEYLFLTVIVMSIMQIIIVLLELGKFVRFVPKSVMLGFVNKLAIVIFWHN